MSSFEVRLLLVSMLISIAVGAAPIQTEVVTRSPVWPTAAQPQPISTYKSAVNTLQVGIRNDEVPGPTPLIKLTPCARAILGCCVPEVKNLQSCFEELKCGPFIFDRPCDRRYMSQALGGAERFYSQFIPSSNN